jgi:phenylalanyl-tRNA synthetase alpha chain
MRVLAAPWRRLQSSLAPQISVLGKSYPRDEYTNISPAIVAKLDRRLHAHDGHPISTLRALIEAHFSDYKHLSALSPLVTPHQNFDSLSFPADHPGRAKTDSYYLNKHCMLRTHTSAHEVDVFASGAERWLLTADVYRRDEIDASHYPVFHQMEGARVFPVRADSLAALEAENARLARALAHEHIAVEDVADVSPANPAQPAHDPAHAAATARNLRLALNGVLYALFGGGAGEPLRVRWIEAYFPFTSPSYEVEVFFRGKWLEILGCGVVLQSTLDRASAFRNLLC